MGKEERKRKDAINAMYSHIFTPNEERLQIFTKWAKEYKITKRIKPAPRIRELLVMDKLPHLIYDHVFTFKNEEGQRITTSQPYNLSEDDEEFDLFREEMYKHQILVEYIGGEFSWWNPGGTYMIHTTDLLERI